MNFFKKLGNLFSNVSLSISKKISEAKQEFSATKPENTHVIKVRKREPDKTIKQIKIINNLNTDTKMTMFNYGVGGNEVRVDANEAIQEIPGNKTLLVSKLTIDEAVSPEIVSGLKTVEDVFKHYSPNVDVQHSTEDGDEIKENFRFNNLADFTPKKLVENSDFLKNLKLKEEQYNKIVKQLRVNKVLRKLLDDPTSKKEFIEALKAIAKELENK